MKHIQARDKEKAKAKGRDAGVDRDSDLRNRKENSVAEAQGGEGKWRARQWETWAGPTWQGLGGHCTGFRFYSNAMQRCPLIPRFLSSCFQTFTVPSSIVSHDVICYLLNDDDVLGPEPDNLHILSHYPS